MMRTLRENTKWIMVITAVAFVGLMVVEWGMDLSGRTSAEASGGQIGRIDGDAVTYEEFLVIYRRLYDQQQQMQDEPITTALNRQIEQAAWDQLVMDRLLAKEIRRRGLQATTAEVRQAARTMPPPEFATNDLFRTDGQFDLRKYQDFLASPSADDQLLLQLEAYYQNIIPRGKLYQQVVGGAHIADGELWRMWRDQYETATVRFLSFDPAALVPETAVSVSDREVEAFYRENRRDFIRPARASVRSTVLERGPTAADSMAARERAAGLRREILAGADFAAVARAQSDDVGSAQQGGDLGTFEKGAMVPVFEEAAWAQPLNQVGEPVLSPFGYHIIQVRSRTAETADARHILIRIEPGEATQVAQLEQADSLERLGARLSIDRAAAEMNLVVRPADLTPDFPMVPAVGRAEEGMEWAFSDTEVGEVSPVFETPTAFYMLELVERVPAGTLTLQEATPGIRARLMAKKRLEAAHQRGRDLVDQVRSTSLDQVAGSLQLRPQEAGPFTRTDFVPGMGRMNAAIGTVFGLQPGQVSGLVEADGMLYIIEVLDRGQADREQFEAERESLRARLAVNAEQERWARFLDEMKDRAKIVDNRDAILRPEYAANVGIRR